MDMSTQKDTKISYTDKNGNPRVVITGTGVISPVGKDTASFWEALVEGRHGIAPLTLFNPDDYKVKLAAEVKDFDPMQYMDRKEARRMDRYCQFAVAAAKEAVESSGIPLKEMDPFDVGVIIGSGVGGLNTMQTQTGQSVAAFYSYDDQQHGCRQSVDDLRC
jgi:3-oxoacyl-[acyl-carrier-protein] synthase II